MKGGPDVGETRSEALGVWLTQSIAFSLIVHLTIGYVAIRTTAGASLGAVHEDTTMVFLKALEPVLPPPRPISLPPPGAIKAGPPPLGFLRVGPPTTVPLDIPPVDLNERFNPADFTGKGVEGGVAQGVKGGTGPVTRTQPIGQPRAFAASQVDEPVELLSIPMPQYPPTLRLAGVAGRVVVQYVVDTTGHPEPGSWRVLSSTNPLFETPTREAIMQARFSPDAGTVGPAARPAARRVHAQRWRTLTAYRR